MQGRTSSQRRLPTVRRPVLSSSVAGSSAARLARSVRDAEVGGSNPLSPTDPGVAAPLPLCMASNALAMTRPNPQSLNREENDRPVGDPGRDEPFGQTRDSGRFRRYRPWSSRRSREPVSREEALVRAARAELDDVREALVNGEALDRDAIQPRAVGAILRLESSRLAPSLNPTGSSSTRTSGGRRSAARRRRRCARRRRMRSRWRSSRKATRAAVGWTKSRRSCGC